MSLPKYQPTGNKIMVLGRTLYQIQALRSFDNAKEGDLGGWIEKEENLSQEGNAWVGGNAKAFDHARVYDNALVMGNAEINGNARIYGESRVLDHAQIYGYARICGHAIVSGTVRMYEYAKISGIARVGNQTVLFGDARISGNAIIQGATRISQNARIENDHDLAVFYYVGSARNTLTVFRAEKGEIRLNRGCFYGTLEQFEKAVKENHEGTRYEKEYLSLIEFIKIRFDVVSK